MDLEEQKKIIKKNFPFPTYRDGQEEVVIDCMDAFNEKKVVVLRADVGTGKSPVAVALGKIFNDAFYVTPQKMLQRQLMDDFSKDMTLVLGRNNFTCKNRKGFTCSEGLCIIKKKFDCEAECQYKNQRDFAVEHPFTLMNFAYFMLSGRMFGERKTLIIDEAHNIPNLCMDYVNLTLSEKDVGLIPHDEYRSKYDTVYQKKSFSEYLTWLKDDIMPEVSLMVKDTETKINLEQDDEILNILTKELRKNVSFEKRINRMLKDFEFYKEEWAVQIEFNDIENEMSIKFQPLTVGRFLKDMLWNRADNIILMSGSIPNTKRFLFEIGLTKRDYLDKYVKSPFPKEKRPVVFIPCGKMTKSDKDFTFPKMAKIVLKILEKHKNVKGIIHCHSYSNAETLVNYLGIKFRDRLIIQDRSGREESLKEFMSSKEPKVFISVNMTEGLDLKDDLCRFQIMMKVPFMFLGDERIKIRVQEKKEWDWYNEEAIKSIIQMYGRAVRSNTDFAVCYILDSSFDNLYNRNKIKFNESFREALQIPGQKRR